MNVITDIVARVLFALPMAIFGLFHFMNANEMADIAPVGGVFVVYITGVALIAAAVSIVIRKFSSLATLLLGVFLILTALAVHLPGAVNGNEMSMPQVMKDISLAGAALFMSGRFKNDGV